MQGGGHERSPDRGEHGKADRSSSPDDGEVPGGHGQHVAEQIADQIVAVAARRQGQHDEAKGQRGMGQDPEQGIGREAAGALEHDKEERDGDGNPEHPDPEADAEHGPERHAKQRGMGHRVAEVRHSAPQQDCKPTGGATHATPAAARSARTKKSSSTAPSPSLGAGGGHFPGEIVHVVVGVPVHRGGRRVRAEQPAELAV